MLNKRYKILILLFVLLFFVGLIYFLLTKNNTNINTNNTIKELVKQSSNIELETELMDLKGPKQKYINKTYGFSLEFLDEIGPFNIEFENNSLKQPFSNEQSCVKNLKGSFCNILDKTYNFRLFYWIGFDLNIEKDLELVCNDQLINEKNKLDLKKYIDLGQDVYKSFTSKEIDGVIDGLNYKGFEVIKTEIAPVGDQPEIRIKTHRKSANVNIYTCLNEDVLLNLYGTIDTYTDDIKRFEILHKQIYEIINSFELIKE